MHKQQALVDVGGVSRMGLLHGMVKASRVHRAPVDGEITGDEIPGVVGAPHDSPHCFLAPKLARFFLDPRRYDEDHGVGALQGVVMNIWLDAQQTEETQFASDNIPTTAERKAEGELDI
ncbi:hypothetical protein BKA56DRAFT_682383 [Ilyonectria sp. MPI-CAGE-AT-0026]|nr:hypothetical protein BKA56DRAFT_682383 [Ilyonectria sp. MPI-CAGE-AT-0026]